MTLPEYVIPWGDVNDWLVSNIPLEAVLAIPALLIAILIPIAILLVDRKGSGYEWDKAVVLTMVLNAKLLFFSVILLSIAPIFWSLPNVQIPILIILTLSLIILLISISGAYKWLVVTEKNNSMQESYRTRKRIEYLKSLSDDQKSIIWSLTWGEEKGTVSLIDDRELIKIFMQGVADIKHKDRPSANILREFISNIDKIDLTDPIIHELLVHFSLDWASSLAHRKDKDTETLGFQITARKLYFTIMKHDLSDKSGYGAFLLYNDSRSYFKNKDIDDSYFLKYFSVEFFDTIGNLSHVDHIWDEFPPEWLITTHNLETIRNTTLQWLTAYMRWINGRNLLISRNNGEVQYDTVADEITRRILPNIDLGLWSDLIVFHWSPYGLFKDETSEHAHIRGFIERDKRFGLIGRVYGFWEVSDGNDTNKRFREERDSEFNETVKIAKSTTSFPLLLNQKMVDIYISELKNFTLEKDSDEFAKLQKLEEIFRLFKTKDEK